MIIHIWRRRIAVLELRSGGLSARAIGAIDDVRGNNIVITTSHNLDLFHDYRAIRASSSVRAWKMAVIDYRHRNGDDLKIERFIEKRRKRETRSRGTRVRFHETKNTSAAPYIKHNCSPFSLAAVLRATV